jgi:hypothetical protein
MTRRHAGLLACLLLLPARRADAQPDLTCAFDLSQAVEDVVLPAIGLRCCSGSPP